MTLEDLDRRADAVIATGTTSAMAAAVIPLPVADVVAITGAQVTMLGALSLNYGKTIDKSTLAGLTSIYMGGVVGQGLASLVKLFPGIGTFVGGSIQMAIAGAITASMGLGMKALLRAGKPITRENLRSAADAAKPEAEELAKRQRAAADAKVARDQVVRDQVQLRAHTKRGGIEVAFELRGLPRSTLRVIDSERRELASCAAVAADSPKLVESSLFRPRHEYSVVLDVQDTAVPTTVRI